MPPVPNYRQEVSIYAVAPALMASYGRQLIDTLHERVGEEEQLRGTLLATGEQDEWAKELWGRVIFRDGKGKGEPRGIYGGNQGPSYNSKLAAFQIGLDVYRHVEKDDDGNEADRDHVGIMGTYGGARAEVDHNLLDRKFRAGMIKMEGWSLGAYWTHFEPNGAYLDLVGHVTFYDFKLQSFRLPMNETDGFGLALSAEGGYPFHIEDDWLIEPQAQVIYQALSIDDFDDLAANVRFRDIDSLLGRVGLRFANIGEKQVWLRGNIWHEFLGEGRTEFSSADGYIPFRADLPETWWQIGLGASIFLDKRVTIYGQGSYDEAFDGRSHGWNAKLGLRFNF